MYADPVSDVYLVRRDLPARDQPWQRVEGAQRAAQDVIEGIMTPVGSLPWDRTPSGGSFLGEALNSVVTPDEVIAEMERVALLVPGIVPASVQAAYDPPTDTYMLHFIGPAFVRVTLRSQPGNPQSMTIV